MSSLPARGDTPLEKALALELVTDMDLLRLKPSRVVPYLPGEYGELTVDADGGDLESDGRKTRPGRDAPD